MRRFVLTAGLILVALSYHAAAEEPSEPPKSEVFNNESIRKMKQGRGPRPAADKGRGSEPGGSSAADPGFGVAVYGDAGFERQVRKALRLIAQRDPSAFLIVSKHIGVIQQSARTMTGGEMWVGLSAPSAELENRTVFFSLTYCAGVIVHEACHSRQWQDYLVASKTRGPDPGFGSFEAVAQRERDCFKVQLESLGAMGAPENEMAYLRTADGKHGDFNNDGKLDEEDDRIRAARFFGP